MTQRLGYTPTPLAPHPSAALHIMCGGTGLLPFHVRRVLGVTNCCQSLDIAKPRLRVSAVGAGNPRLPSPIGLCARHSGFCVQQGSSGGRGGNPSRPTQADRTGSRRAVCAAATWPRLERQSKRSSEVASESALESTTAAATARSATLSCSLAMHRELPITMARTRLRVSVVGRAYPTHDLESQAPLAAAVP